MQVYIFTYCFALLLSCGLTRLVILWAGRHNMVDHPNARNVHIKPVVSLGGIAIFAGAVLAILSALLIWNALGEQFGRMRVKIITLLAGSTIVFITGLYDDIKHVRAVVKLTAEIVAALAVCVAGAYIREIHVRDLITIHLGWWGCPITVLWIVGITNAVNMIDGLDGLAAGIAAIACGVIAAISLWQGDAMLAVIMLALLGSLTGFLFFNFHPAKIFMGDCGSLLLGFVIATASILAANKADALVGIGLPVLVLGIPIFDTLFSMLRRFLYRRGIMSPDRAHFHHWLLDLGLKQHQITIAAYLITLTTSGLGLLMFPAQSIGSVMILISCLMLLLLTFHLVGAVRLHEVPTGIRKRVELHHKLRTERRAFEEAQLCFRNAKTFDKWWRAVCKAASLMDLAWISLKTMDESGRVEQYLLRTFNSTSDTPRIVIMIVPFGGDRKDRQQFELAIRVDGSIEATGRKATFFARLLDEHAVEIPQYLKYKPASPCFADIIGLLGDSVIDEQLLAANLTGDSMAITSAGNWSR